MVVIVCSCGGCLMQIDLKGFGSTYIQVKTVDQAISIANRIAAGTKQDPEYMQWVESLRRVNRSYTVPTNE